MIELARLRQETPGCRTVTHLNNAGASLSPQPVIEAVARHLVDEQSMGFYEAEDAARPALARFYASIATLLNCGVDEIAYCENSTRAWDMAFYSVRLERGDRILTCQTEYASNFLAMLQVAERKGVEIGVIPGDGSGQIDVAALDRMIDKRTKLIAVTHVPTGGGLVNPVAKVGAIARAHGVMFLLDACQSVGQLPVDVQAIGCDLLAGTGRKWLRGPRATGFLYVHKSILDRLDPIFIDLHAADWVSERSYRLRPDAKRFENWESNVAGRIGLAVAVDYALAIGIDRIAERNGKLAAGLRQQLERIPGVSVEDRGEDKCAIVTFQLSGVDAASLRDQLRARKINVSVSTVGYSRLDYEPRGLTTIARVSPHYYNSEAELELFTSAVAQFGAATNS